MDDEKDPSHSQVLRSTSESEQGADSAHDARNTVTMQTIQLTPNAGSTSNEKADNGTDGGNRLGFALTSRRHSVAFIPQVMSAMEKKRHRRQKEHEKKHVDIDEHLMSPQAVAARYRTNIRMDRPETSLGLSSQEAEERLREHGLNILTPHKTRHPFVKYLICLSSLFNLLLILAGALEYILLGINFTENLQNVGPTLTQAKD